MADSTDLVRSISPSRASYLVTLSRAAGNRFVFFTPDMPPDLLARYGLERQDVLTASDHLPLVADFALERSPAP